MSVAEDVVMETNDTLRSEMIEGHNSVREAVSLLRVWLTQRQLNQGYGAFTTFIMSMYVIYLMKIQKINHHMSSYQILRNVWLSLSTTDWTTDGPSMVSSALLKVIPLSVFHEHFDVVFVDSTGLCNLTARMNKYTYWKVM
ncbi:hypothetical protein AAG570_003879 [Ranatra chinensis]|uniref:Nucleolar protein 6 n=1 Tax=Ranatra chinensis TaxID=642074 RepID=A0ABD0Y256_9HEMI